MKFIITRIFDFIDNYLDFINVSGGYVKNILSKLILTSVLYYQIKYQTLS